MEWLGNKKPALEQIGPLAIAGVAAFAAWFAAHTANRRQERQLEHAEREQKRSLENDRRLNDRDFMRTTTTSVLGHCLDATEMYNDLRSGAFAISSVRSAVEITEQKGAEDPTVREAAGSGAIKLRARAEEEALTWAAEREAASKKVMVVIYDNVRLVGLMGSANEVTKAHKEFIDALKQLDTALSNLAHKFPSSGGSREAADSAEVSISAAITRFTDALLDEFKKPLWETSDSTEDHDRSKTRLLRRRVPDQTRTRDVA